MSPLGYTNQNVAASAIEPRDDNDLISGAKTSEPFKHLRLEDQPGLGCAFVGLAVLIAAFGHWA